MNDAELADELAGLLRLHLPGGDPNGPIPEIAGASGFGIFAQDDYKAFYFRLFARMLTEYRLVTWGRLSEELYERHSELYDEKILVEGVLPELEQHWDAWTFMWENRRLLP